MVDKLTRLHDFVQKLPVGYDIIAGERGLIQSWEKGD